jgi:hypothetical protein
MDHITKWFLVFGKGSNVSVAGLQFDCFREGKERFEVEQMTLDGVFEPLAVIAVFWE